MKKLVKALAAAAVGSCVLMLFDADTHALAPPGQFTTRADGTVLDTMTGLLWQQGFSPATQTQATSLAYCTGLGTAGGGWRLPTVLELSSIVDETLGGSLGTSAIDPTAFPLGTPREYFWTASPVTGVAGLGWRVSFFDGAVDPHDVTVNTNHYARCVR